MKRWGIFFGASFAAIGAFFFFREEPKRKHAMHDDAAYRQFCAAVITQPELYDTFRSHPLYHVFQEDLNEVSAKECLFVLKKQYPYLLIEKDLIKALDAVGHPRKIALSETQKDLGEISYPTLRNLKIAGDVERLFGNFRDKTIVQIGASDGSLCKILITRHHPARYCIVDLPESLAVAKKTLGDWGVHNVEFYTPETFVLPKSLDLAISPFVFAESSRKFQEHHLRHILCHAHHGYLDCRFPLRHFGVKVWTKEQIIARLESVGKQPQLLQEEPLTDIDHCLILFAPFDLN